jgi:hypothetical protein
MPALEERHQEQRREKDGAEEANGATAETVHRLDSG